MVAGGWEHADEADIAAERDQLEPVLGLPAAARPERTAEPDEVLGRLDPEDLPGYQVADLVQRDRGHHQSEEDDGPADVDRDVHLAQVLPVRRDELGGPRPGPG